MGLESRQASKDALVGPQPVEDGRAVHRQTSRRTSLGMFERNRQASCPSACEPGGEFDRPALPGCGAMRASFRAYGCDCRGVRSRCCGCEGDGQPVAGQPAQPAFTRRKG